MLARFNCTSGKLKIGDNEYYRRNEHDKHSEVKSVFTVTIKQQHMQRDIFYQAKV